jgi:hypothetical protein
MKKILAFGRRLRGAAFAQTSVSIGINQPGVGRITIGDVLPG